VVHGIAVRADRLFRGRDVKAIDLAGLSAETGAPKLPPATWIINSVRSRPVNAPEPRLLGQRREPPPAAKPAAPAPRPAAVPTPHLPVSVSRNGHVPATGDDAAKVMLRFQDLMARFLDTQKAVMTGYLQGSGGAPELPAMPEWNTDDTDRTDEDGSDKKSVLPDPSSSVASVPSVFHS